MSQAHALSAGSLVDTFEVERVLGTGAFGITYKAFDRVLHRAVAIKEYCPSHLARRSEDNQTLTPRTASDTEAYSYGLEGFLREARTLAQFHEPNIVRVSRYMEGNGTAYFVMDYEEGQPLSEVLNRIGRLSEQQVRALLVHVLRGLVAVHGQSFLHRDIKPGNIFIRQSGPPVLLDFGAARQALEQRAGTLTVVLTPGYAPMEQYGGDRHQGPWSDLYALGATVYHCALGTKPPGSMERVAAIHAGQPDPVAEGLAHMQASLSPAIVNAVQHMLMLQSHERPQSAREVLDYIMADRRRQTMAAAQHTVAQPGPLGQDGYAGSTGSFGTYGAPGSGHGTYGGMGPAQGGYPPGTQQPSGPLSSGPGGYAPSSGSYRATSDTPSSQSISESVLEAAEHQLALYVGPIAKVLVKRAAQRYGSRRDFCQALADEIDEADERAEFLRAMR